MLLKRILSPEEETERAMKALELNGFTNPDYDPRFDPKLLAASSVETYVKDKTIIVSSD